MSERVCVVDSAVAVRTFVMTLFVSLAAVSCGSKPASPTAPSSPSVPAPVLACATDISVVGLGPSQPVSFTAPTVTGGVAPITTTCTPASGTAFPVGTTKVTCLGTDAAAQTGSCSLSVRVTAPVIGVTKFQAVGDSLTEGQNGLPIQPGFVDPPNSYPTKLNGLLNAAFPSQGIAVVNRGHGGDTVNQTKDSLPGFLATDRPEAVLLLAGYNNLTTPCHVGLTVDQPDCDSAVELVEDVLRECIRIIKGTSSVRYIFIGLLTPSGSLGAGTSSDLRIDPSAIQSVNNRLRDMAAIEGAIVADTFTPFVGHEAEYVSIDGLHLRPAGYQAIADTFFAKILATVPQSNPAFVR